MMQFFVVDKFGLFSGILVVQALTTCKNMTRSCEAILNDLDVSLLVG